MSYGKGWRPDRPDHRDKVYSAPAMPADLPARISLRTSPNNGPVLDQGQLGACVPNSNASMYYFVLGKDGLPQFLPSRLYIYALGRRMEGTPLSEDSGMQVRDALKVLAAGAPPESDDPYSDANPGPFNDAPDARTVAAAKLSHAVSYSSINPQAAGYPLRTCIAEGYPFAFGFTVPAGLESDQMASGQVKLLELPGPGNESLNEGHAVQCVGYDFTCSRFPVDVFEVKNSWGSDWCDGGYFFMDARYFWGTTPQASSLWTLRTVVES
jgi:C1A family cysteine protease